MQLIYQLTIFDGRIVGIHELALNKLDTERGFSCETKCQRKEKKRLRKDINSIVYSAIDSFWHFEFVESVGRKLLR